MYEGGEQVVLRCGQCNKPFDKESTLKRHGYYCRSRRAGGTTRPRSCTACAREKARCDTRQPECSRCMSKAIACCYPAERSRQRGLSVQDSSLAPSQQRTPESSLVAESLSTENRQKATEADGAILDPDLAVTKLDFASIEDEHLGEHTIPPDFPAAQTHDKTGYQPSWEVSSLLDAPTALIRSFDRRPDIKDESQSIANLLLQNLKSYPQMVMVHNSLPPFVHPLLISFEAKHDDMESLTNCLNLVHMLSSPYQRCGKLFWRDVRLECERWCAGYLEMNRWQLVTAMQALLIYILIRLGEGETEHNNLDALLVRTVVLTASQFNITNMTQTNFGSYNHNLNARWKAWILDESARRLCVVYQVLGMLVHFEPAAMCDELDIVLAPLPARKQLWEASDEKAWKAESERESGLHATFGLAANGDLVQVHESQMHHGDAVLHQRSYDTMTSLWDVADWQEWCSGMDGFGGLIMLAASFRSQ